MPKVLTLSRVAQQNGPLHMRCGLISIVQQIGILAQSVDSQDMSPSQKANFIGSLTKALRALQEAAEIMGAGDPEPIQSTLGRSRNDEL